MNRLFPLLLLLFLPWIGHSQYICDGNSRYPSDWKFLGPGEMPLQTLGLISAVAALPESPEIVYAGNPNGGLFRTQNALDSLPVWECLTESTRLPYAGIADILIIPEKNRKGFHDLYIVYGQQTFNPQGYGVLKSADDGKSWEITGLNPTRLGGYIQIKKLFLKPGQPQRIYAIAPDEVYYTDNGGKEWKDLGFKTFHQSTNPASIDLMNLVFNPLNPEIFYLSGKKLWRADHSGRKAKFSEHTSSLSTPCYKEEYIRLSATETRMYALYRDALAAPRIDVSEDGGESWKLLTKTATLGLFFIVSPQNPAIMYIGDDIMGGQGRRVNKSINGGKTFHAVSEYFPDRLYHGVSTHCDIRAMRLIQASADGNNDFLLAGTDGGVLHSLSARCDSTIPIVNWRNINGKGLSVTQFWGIGGYEEDPDMLMGGTQDNDLYLYRKGTWSVLVHCDGYECIIDPKNPDILYAQKDCGGGIQAVYSKDGGKNYIFPNKGMKFDAQNRFRKPMKLDPVHQYWYLGFHDLYRMKTDSVSVHKSWEKFTDFTRDHGVPDCWKLAAIAIPDINPDVMYVGYENATWNADMKTCDPTCKGCGTSEACKTEPAPGNCPVSKKLFKSLDKGASWMDITDVGQDKKAELSAVRWAGIKDIAVNPDKADEVFVAFGGHWEETPGSGKGIQRIMHSIDGGKSWTDYSDGLLPFAVNCLTYYSSKQWLFAGTDVGIWVRNTADPSGKWECYNNGLPVTTITDLEINSKASLLRAATYGRGIWETRIR